MTPDERTYRQHVARGRFLVAVDRGDWRTVRDVWPNPIIAVAAEAREGAPVEFAFRFDLAGYPAVGPTSQPWDLEDEMPLAHELWPAGTGRVEAVFNPGWQPVQNVHALYHPMDRLAAAGHGDWPSLDPGSIWDPTRMDIVDYLKVIHDLLHSTSFSGIRRAA